MRTRLVVAASFLILWGQSEALGVWIGVPDFPDIVRGADLCVYGRVTSARELSEEEYGARRFHCAADFDVDGVIFGPCKERERITIYYRSGMIDDTSFTPPEEYVVLLTELAPPLKGYRSHALHLGVFHITNRGIIRVPEKLRNPPKTRDRRNFGDFLDEIRYLRGPKVAVRPTKPSFRWDEPVTLEVTFTNPAFREMKLLFAPPPLAEYSYFDQYLSAEGLPICDPGVPRQADDPKPVEVVLPGKQSMTRNVTFPPHFARRAWYNLASIAHIALMYSTVGVQGVEGAWKGSAVPALAPIKIVCDDADLARKLADAGKRFAFMLCNGRRTLTSGQPAKITAVVAHLASPARREIMAKPAFVSLGCSLPRLPEEHRAALARQLRVTRDGRRVEMKQAEGQAAPWLRKLLKSNDSPTYGWLCLGVELDLGKHFDLTQPGHYTVRLVVPPEETGEKRALASNLVEFDVAAPQDE